ncbi:glycerophosphoryl diester phosphodiesterase membrane domain-containing protein [Sphingomonas sp. LT1P40]|uniref:glycerophosphoryl diester phosphodiesterase membrane domain-containing protein n=1 Tax=Alteristakelama amylovorans TaxID=3096166 RepID=UPI002FC70796
MISMGNVWDRTAEFLSDNLGTILPIALLAIFVPAVVSANVTELQQGATPGLSAGLGIGSLLLALVTFWGQLAITALAIDPSLSKSATSVATRRFPAALLVMVVLVVAMLLLAIPVGVILAFSGVNFASVAPGSMPEIPPGAGMWLTLYGLILIPLLLWIFARLVVTLPVIVGERVALGAVSRSWSLTRGVALKIVGVILLYGIVAIVANLAATSAFGAIMYLVAGRGDGGLSLATVLTTIVGGAVSTAFTVLGTAFTAKLFVALLAREATPAP